MNDVVVSAILGVNVALETSPDTAETCVTVVVVDVTTQSWTLIADVPVADVSDVLILKVQMPAAYEPAVDPSNIQPVEFGVVGGTVVVAFARVPGMNAHVATVFAFLTEVPLVAAEPNVVESSLIDGAADAIVELNDRSAKSATDRSLR